MTVFVSTANAPIANREQRMAGHIGMNVSGATTMPAASPMKGSDGEVTAGRVTTL